MITFHLKLEYAFYVLLVEVVVSEAEYLHKNGSLHEPLESKDYENSNMGTVILITFAAILGSVLVIFILYLCALMCCKPIPDNSNQDEKNAEQTRRGSRKRKHRKSEASRTDCDRTEATAMDNSISVSRPRHSRLSRREREGGRRRSSHRSISRSEYDRYNRRKSHQSRYHDRHRSSGGHNRHRSSTRRHDSYRNSRQSRRSPPNRYVRDDWDDSNSTSQTGSAVDNSRSVSNTAKGRSVSRSRTGNTDASYSVSNDKSNFSSSVRPPPRAKPSSRRSPHDRPSGSSVDHSNSHLGWPGKPVSSDKQRDLLVSVSNGAVSASRSAHSTARTVSREPAASREPTHSFSVPSDSVPKSDTKPDTNPSQRFAQYQQNTQTQARPQGSSGGSDISISSVNEKKTTLNDDT